MIKKVNDDFTKKAKMVENKSPICEICGKHADLGCKHYPVEVKLIQPHNPPPLRVYKDFFGVMVLMNKKEIEEYRELI